MGGLHLFWGGISPPKPSHGDTTNRNPLLSYGGKMIVSCTWQLNIILKISGGLIARLFPSRMWACLPSKTLHVNCKSWCQCRSHTVRPPVKMCWAQLGHSLTITPTLRKLFVLPGVPSWLRSWSMHMKNIRIALNTSTWNGMFLSQAHEKTSTFTFVHARAYGLVCWWQSTLIL